MQKICNNSLGSKKDAVSIFDGEYEDHNIHIRSYCNEYTFVYF